MRTSDGLTREREMTEQQHVTKLLVMPACEEVNNAMQEIPDVNYNTCETDARQARDLKETHSSELISVKKTLLPLCKLAQCLNWGPRTHYCECFRKTPTGTPTGPA